MNGNTTTLFGVTLRISSSHPSSLAVLNHQSHLIQLSLFHTDLELLQLAGIYRPTLIAIGLPYACQQAFPTWNPPGTPLLLPQRPEGASSSGNWEALASPAFSLVGAQLFES